MHSVSPIYTMPTILNSLKLAQNSALPKGAAAQSKTTAATKAAATTSTPASSSLGSTFLNLLSKELQNQDPTAPVDSTAMVGQMISLNQLDQLISINQGINGASTGTTATGGVQNAGATASALSLGSADGGVGGLLSPSTAGAASSQLPFDPNTMMPVGSGNSAAMAATINSSLNAANMGLSGTNNNSTGGK